MKIKIVKTIKRKGYPTSSPYYKEAHDEADHYEKKHSPKEYAAMKKVDKKLKPNELVGTHTKKGKVTESKSVPKKYRQDVAKNHEIPELKADKRLRNEKKR
jgi:hypothetical protein